MDGGAEGSRTPDLLIANEALYQLSYDPIHLLARCYREEFKSRICSFYAASLAGTMEIMYRTTQIATSFRHDSPASTERDVDAAD
jgi:hypothetical protein